jgi:NTP pyrophosphatase (non-canonical NTP hydrolase)
MDETKTRDNDARSISYLIRDCYKIAKDHGWWDDSSAPINFPEKLALIHSEVSEALEEYRNPEHPIGELYFVGDNKKPEGVPAELADVLIRIFDLCGHYGIDLENAVYQKMLYNTSRPFRHGGKRA